MAADLHYPPTSFLAEDNKTPIGYNVDIAQLLGKKMGLKVKIKNVSFARSWHVARRRCS